MTSASVKSLQHLLTHPFSSRERNFSRESRRHLPERWRLHLKGTAARAAALLELRLCSSRGYRAPGGRLPSRDLPARPSFTCVRPSCDSPP